MSNLAGLYAHETSTNYFGVATVLGVEQSEGSTRVQIKLSKEGIVGWARIALASNDIVQKGDEVLALGDDINDLFVIGLLSSPTVSEALEKKTDIGGGAFTLLDTSNKSSGLKVFSKRNELVFEYDPTSEKMKVNIESGDLELKTQKGDIVLNAHKNILLKGRSVDISSLIGVKLAVSDSFGQLRSSFSLGEFKTKLSSSEFNVTAKLGKLKLDEIELFSKNFLGKIKNSKLIVGKLSTVAETIIEKSQNVYRTVEKLSQLKAGRMRTLISGTSHFKSKNTYIKSEEAYKVNAEKIHLG